MPADEVARFVKVSEEFDDVFQEPGKPQDRAITHRIDLVDETKPPPKFRLYRMSEPELAEVRRQLDEMVAKGWIRPSVSPYGHPILFARKKDGGLRMCVDYRSLNKNTRLDRYPIPRVDDILDRMAGARYFSKIDLASGYHQVAIEPGHEHRTAFASRWGLFEFTVMPFGLVNAPSTFQRLMNVIFSDCLDRFVTVYLDDIMVYSRTAAEHEEHLRDVFRRLRSNGLCAKRKKCAFGLE